MGRRRLKPKPPRSTEAPAPTQGWIQWLSVGFAFCAPFVFKRGLQDFANLPQSIVIQLGSLALLVVLALGNGRQAGFRLVRSPLDWPLVLLLAWAGVSLAWAQNPFEGLTVWLQWTACALFYVVVVNSFGRGEDSRRLLLALFLAGLGVSVLGTAQHLWGFGLVPQIAPPAATFANKNMAAHVIVMTLPLGLGLFLSSGRVAAAALALACAVMAAYLVHTSTRAGWLAVGIELLVLAGLVLWERLRSRRPRPWPSAKLVSALVGIAAWLVLINLTPAGLRWQADELVSRAATIVSPIASPAPETEVAAAPVAAGLPTTGLDTSILERFALWRNTWEMIVDHPWGGVGLGNHIVHYPLYAHRAVPDRAFSVEQQQDYAHNDYLQTAAELGLPGIAAMLWLALTILRMLIRTLTMEPDPARRRLTVGVAVALVGVAVNAVFSFPFQRALPPFLLAALLGVLSARHAELAGRANEASGRTLAPRIPTVAAGVAGIVLLVLALFHYRQIAANGHFLQAVVAARGGAWSQAIASSRRAQALIPWEKRVMIYAGHAALMAGRNTEAVEFLEDALRYYPNRMNVLANLAIAYARLGQPERALPLYQRAITIKPDFAPFFVNLAYIELQQGNIEGALAAYHRASGLDPEVVKDHEILRALDARRDARHPAERP